MKGKFISFEGGEGAGKSTQIQLLKESLNKRGIPTVVTREMGGTPGAEQIRTLLKEGDDARWDGLSESLLLYAARHDHVIKVIQPALNAGKWVLCDRFADSTMAYQGYARGVNLEDLQILNYLVLKEFRPDITFILDVPAEVGLRRAQLRAQANQEVSIDRFERMKLESHQKLRGGFLEIAKSSPHYHVIEGDRPQGVIAADILQVAEGLI